MRAGGDGMDPVRWRETNLRALPPDAAAFWSERVDSARGDATGRAGRLDLLQISSLARTHAPSACANPQAKKFVESTPQVLKDNVPKEDAEKLKATLEALGATISLS